MRRLMCFRRVHDDERGVTMVIVALSLIALMGMVVLVVDVGGLLWKRRELVNSADAAALSAAKTCSDPQDATAPEGRADAQAVSNASGLTGANGGVVDSYNCVPASTDGASRGSSGFVTVRYTQPQDLFFAPVLGFGQNSAVTTEATAAWAPLGGGKAVPIVLESSTFQGTCDVPDGVEVGDECSFWYDNGALGGIGAANWGFLDLQHWDVDRFDNNACNSAGGAADREDFILYDYGEPLALRDPGPTYVCSMTGHATANWQDLLDRMNGGYDGWPGASILMPVNECDLQVDKNGTIVPCGTGTPDKFAIIGFTQLRLAWVLKGDDDEPIEVDGTPAAIGYGGVAGSSGSCTDEALGLDALGMRNLGALADAECGAPAPSDIDRIPYSSVVVTSPGQGGTPAITYTKCPPIGGENCDYRYDESTFQLTWVNNVTQANGRPKEVDLTWEVDGVPPTPGKCGLETSDPNALCLVLVWEGFVSVGDMIPGSGPDLGVRTFVLCDYDYSSCPVGSRP
jgi:Flp pilus assembly protein TadG